MRPHLSRYLTSLAAVAALLGAAQVADARPRAVRADLDGDARLERVRVVKKDGLKFLRVIDRTGGRVVRRRISHRAKRVRLFVRDFNADGTRDIWFDGGGPTRGAAPRIFGLYDWTGSRRKVLWSYHWRHSSLGRRWGGAGANFVSDSSRYPGREIALSEGLRRKRSAFCCSRLRISLYGFSPSAGRYVRYERFFVRPSKRGRASASRGSVPPYTGSE